MQNRCVVVRRRDAHADIASLVEWSGCVADEVVTDQLDERDISAIVSDPPYAVVLPLSLWRYGSLRLAELVAVRRLRVRLILVSGTEAPDSVLAELFDCRLRPCGDGLLEALSRSDWTHAFERRTVTLDSALQAVLRSAACFWLSGWRHPETFATLVDYQRSIAEDSRRLILLFVASDPTDRARLRLMRELSEIQRELAKRSDRSFDVKYLFSSRPDELARRLLEDKPHIVHFSGLGDGDGRLCFEDADGGSWPADTSAIAQIFEPVRRYVKCVVLNTCFSAAQARLIGEHIEYAIGLPSSVSDEAAIAMTRGFYGALSVQGRVSGAIRAARTSLQLVSNGAELYSAERTREFSGFGSRGEGTVRDPALAQELAALDVLVADDVVVPIPPGARRVIPGYLIDGLDADRCVIEMHEQVAADAVLALYRRWAELEGWAVKVLDDADGFSARRFTKGARRVGLCIVQGDGRLRCLVRLEPDAATRGGCASRFRRVSADGFKRR